MGAMDTWIFSGPNPPAPRWIVITSSNFRNNTILARLFGMWIRQATVYWLAVSMPFCVFILKNDDYPEVRLQLTGRESRLNSKQHGQIELKRSCMLSVQHPFPCVLARVQETASFEPFLATKMHGIAWKPFTLKDNDKLKPENSWLKLVRIWIQGWGEVTTCYSSCPLMRYLLTCGGIRTWCWHVLTPHVGCWCFLVSTPVRSHARVDILGVGGWGRVGWENNVHIDFNYIVHSHALPHIRHATLLDVLLHFHTYIMLRCLTFSFTSTHTSCYAAAARLSLALPQIHHATLLDILLHFHTYIMLRC